MITVALLAFLVLLLVSLASITRVETAVAANNRLTAQARQHAVMALNIAVGQLQAHAGQDSRLTAQANLLGENVGNPWMTGVWSADGGGTPALRTWLVSGNETNATRFGRNSILGREGPEPDIAMTFDGAGLADNGPESGAPNRVQLVGAATAPGTGTAMAHGGVVAPGVPINAEVLGLAGLRTIGRYAFWVGDQGVKASLALADRTAEVAYAPWYDATPATGYDQRVRIRQQIATAPTFFRRLGGVEERGFDPLDAVNAEWLGRVLTGRHLDLMEPAVAAAPLDAFRREFFHTFTDRASGVLANTLPLTAAQRGLMRDLSQAPGLLGDAFVAQTNLAWHLEPSAAGNTAVPPITTLDSERRRHGVRPPVTSAETAGDPEIEFKVAPVLNSFMLQFRVERISGGAVEVRARMLVELWNPYSAALVPEDMVLEVTGLPTIRVIDTNGSGSVADVDLQSPPPLLNEAGALTVNLPAASNGNTDQASWLPGRLYAWRTNSGTESRNLLFYDKTIGPSWHYASLPMGATDDRLRVEAAGGTVLTIRLKRMDGTILATHESPHYGGFLIADVESPGADGNWKFGYGFRLKQPSSLNLDRDWLLSAGRDFRRQAVGGNAYGAFNELIGTEPELYVGTVKTATDIQNFAVFRAFGVARNSTRSANLDLPVFELPRLPYLSVGELQHLMLPEERPFAAGNSWGGKANSWFDRFFFSGVTAAGATPDMAAGQPLPNWNLRPLDAQAVTAGALSSRYLLQDGAFNVNSALPEAWRAVLSGVRFSPSRAFRRANIDNASGVSAYTGSQPDPVSATSASVDEALIDGTLSDDGAAGGPAFFRFPQTAQETYFWANTAIEGDFKKQAFRQGVRGGNAPIDGSTLHTLTTAQIDALAAAIVARVREHAAVSGPYASMQAFLAPDPAWGNRNLLEQAIVDAGINPAEIAPTSPVPALTDIGFSSLTLTSGDIMTALAPYLRTRSDTFVVRTYGESINPATQEITGRAWCEAVVQRMPAPADSAETNFAAPSATGFGRAFRITQFRWLSPSEI